MADRNVCCAAAARLDGHWLVEVHQHCTCGAGGPEGHEGGCGVVPLVDLSRVPGWAEIARVTAEQALRDAAYDWLQGDWAYAPRRDDRVEERMANAQHVGDWLLARANRTAEDGGDA